jgi:hypothetical protein
MPKSSLRGGAKAHRKRVQERNNRLRGNQRRFQEEYQALMMKQIEALRAQMSGETENTEEVVSDEQPLNIKL